MDNVTTTLAVAYWWSIPAWPVDGPNGSSTVDDDDDRGAEDGADDGPEG